MYERHFNKMKLEKTTVILKTYSGEELSPQGVLQVRVRYDGTTQKLPLYVVNGNGPTLFGRDWLTHMKLKWSELQLLRTTDTTETNIQNRLQQLLKKYEAVFQDQMGTVKDFEAKLVLKDPTPTFCKARPVPFALRPKVGAEIDRLLITGIISKVDRSEWATPVVPLIKKRWPSEAVRRF